MRSLKTLRNSCFGALLATLALTSVGCKTPQSSVIKDDTGLANGSTSFVGPLADRLLAALAQYPGAFATQTGRGIKGLNTSLFCHVNGTCTLSGPTIVNGSLEVTMDDYPASVDQKSIQQKLYEVVKLAPNDAEGATGVSMYRMCQQVTATGRCRFDIPGDILAVTESWDHFTPGSLHSFSVMLRLIPGG